MKAFLLFLSLFVFSALGAKSQSRDTLVTKNLYYINTELNKAVIDTQTVWSNALTDYIDYSRISMGYNMNEGIKFNKIASKQFMAATALSIASSATFIAAAHSDPILYVEHHSKYTRDYYNKAIRKRDTQIIMGSALAAGAVYLFWRSNRNYRKSKWHISPSGVKYTF